MPADDAARVAELRAIVLDLADMQEHSIIDQENWCCVLCGATPHPHPHAPDAAARGAHAPDCVWRRAVQFIQSESEHLS
jgi:hypothetical protein